MRRREGGGFDGYLYTISLICLITKMSENLTFTVDFQSKFAYTYLQRR